MLDFYIIEDQRQKPRTPEELGRAYAGGLDDNTFENLQKKGIVDKRFDDYSDFRWGTEMILQIRQTIQKKKMEKDTDVQKLVILFEAAEQQRSGLIAYGD